MLPHRVKLCRESQNKLQGMQLVTVYRIAPAIIIRRHKAMNDYVRSIVAKVEPEILKSLADLRQACPSADQVCRRGYSHQIEIKSLDEIEQINYLYRQRDLLVKSGERYEVDHIIPLFKGGSHSLENLQLLSCDDHRLKNVEDRIGFDIKQSTRTRFWHCN